MVNDIVTQQQKCTLAEQPLSFMGQRDVSGYPQSALYIWF
jgi:hypothetical protein